jgi:hypothetical protein
LCTCEICGKEIYLNPCRIHDRVFCSNKCKYIGKQNSVSRNCKNCGSEFKVYSCIAQNGGGKFCSKKCADEYNVGPNASGWRGGASFGKYCFRFNKHVRDKVREDFNRKCFLCGKAEEENGRKLSVHHCDYNKSQGCGKAWVLIPLCMACHAHTTVEKRWFWFNLLISYWLCDDSIHLNKNVFYSFDYSFI